MTVILGIDPGSRATGYGVITHVGQTSTVCTQGVIRVEGAALPDKLYDIFINLSRIIETYQPDKVAIEQVFVSKNPDSALKLGQARGSAICAAVFHQKPVAEYSARQVKQAVVGSGAATKSQVQSMVTRLLKLKETPAVDAADALAVALCHAQCEATFLKLDGRHQSKGFRRGRLKASDLPQSLRARIKDQSRDR